MNISIAVAVKDEPEAWRKKQGDIIAVKPGGWQWGSGEVSKYLILEVSIPTNKDVSRILQILYYEGGVLNPDPTLPITIVAKRLFKIDWNLLKTAVSSKGISVNWESVENGNIAYQPLSEQQAAPGGTTTLFDPLDLVWNKHASRKISTSDINSWG